MIMADQIRHGRRISNSYVYVLKQKKIDYRIKMKSAIIKAKQGFIFVQDRYHFLFAAGSIHI